MCGIAGIISSGSKINDGSFALSQLHHRGPDGRGELKFNVSDATAWLGHTRLAILELSPAGHQPMTSRDGRWNLTFNGEIYNHNDLRARLQGEFRGHSDTETLVESLATWGLSETLPQLNGMFAFCAIDTIDNVFYLVRDPFGIKPLYYSILPGRGVAFASEVRALRALAGSTPDIDSDALQTFLTLRYVPSPRTLWQGVYRLAPGHCLRVNIENWQTDLIHYVEPIVSDFTGSKDDAADAYREILAGAVRRQLLSDVPVGLLLSGGIDSALVAALAQENGNALPSFTVGFSKGHAECEIEDAQHTARLLGIPHSVVTVSPDDLWSAIGQVVEAIEEPLGTTSILPMWYLVQKARENVKVVLTGQGTDEPWGGYTRYQGEVVRRLLPFPALLRGGSFLSHWRGIPEYAERALRSLHLSNTGLRFAEAYTMFTATERLALTGRGDDGGSIQIIEQWLQWAGDHHKHPVEKMMMIDSRMNLADDLLLYGDKISMAFSLEARVPMLDLEVVRFIESLPCDFRVSLRKGKIVHKRMAAQYLPQEIVNRRKKGFQVPFLLWSRTVWRDRIADIILDKNAPYWSHFNRKSISTMWREHLKGRDSSRKIFTLLMLSIWWRLQGDIR